MIKVETFAEVYEKMRPLLLNADEVSPRGMKTKEILNGSFCITNPRSRLVYHKDRKFNLIYAIAESLLLFDSSNEVKYYSFFNQKMYDFSDDGKTLNGCYGKRVNHLISRFVDKLKNDKDTRQAILTIYCNDFKSKTKDTPCTLNLHCMIRNNKLNLHVYMRSNDFIWGTQYDVFNFTMFQEVIANELGIDVGEYYHTASSLHVYEQHFEMLENIEKVEQIDFVNPCKIYEMRSAALLMKMKIDGIVGATIEHRNKFVRMITNEMRYKKKQTVKELENDLMFAKNFVKRWYKDGDEKNVIL